MYPYKTSTNFYAEREGGGVSALKVDNIIVSSVGRHVNVPSNFFFPT